MSTVPALDTGLLGIQRSLQGLQKNASTIASARQLSSAGPESLTGALVGLVENRLQAQASAKVVQTVSDTLGTLLDTTA